MLNSLKSILRTFWQGAVRNKGLFFACVLMMTFSLVIFSSIFIFRNSTQNLIRVLEEKMDISLYFKKEVPEEDILKIRDELLGYPDVAAVEYVSQEEALKIFEERNKNNPVIQKVLTEIGENPLSASLNIKAKESNKYETIIQEIEKSAFKDKLTNVSFTENQKVIARLNHFSQAIELVSALVIILLVILSVIITFNTIRMAIYSLRQEIEIMKLVGASPWFIRGPFLIQGAFQGLVASGLSLLILIPLIWWLGPKLENFAPEIGINLYFWSNFGYIILIQTLFGLALGLISSFLAVNKYLKV